MRTPPAPNRSEPVLDPLPRPARRPGLGEGKANSSARRARGRERSLTPRPHPPSIPRMCARGGGRGAPSSRPLRPKPRGRVLPRANRDEEEVVSAASSAPRMGGRGAESPPPAGRGCLGPHECERPASEPCAVAEGTSWLSSHLLSPAPAAARLQPFASHLSPPGRLSAGRTRSFPWEALGPEPKRTRQTQSALSHAASPARATALGAAGSAGSAGPKGRVGASHGRRHCPVTPEGRPAGRPQLGF